MQLHTIIHSLKMANEQLSAADRAIEKHNKNKERERKRHTNELSKARLVDLTDKEDEKKKKKIKNEQWYSVYNHNHN
ncbi:MAG: hypothetical protein H8D80_00225 [Proteobacteria bacterium]|nr:hypothetical protein [Pseudomonadota bacterium]